MYKEGVNGRDFDVVIKRVGETKGKFYENKEKKRNKKRGGQKKPLKKRKANTCAQPKREREKK